MYFSAGFTRKTIPSHLVCLNESLLTYSFCLGGDFLDVFQLKHVFLSGECRGGGGARDERKLLNCLCNTPCEVETLFCIVQVCCGCHFK